MALLGAQNQIFLVLCCYPCDINSRQTNVQEASGLTTTNFHVEFSVTHADEDLQAAINFDDERIRLAIERGDRPGARLVPALSPELAHTASTDQSHHSPASPESSDIVAADAADGSKSLPRGAAGSMQVSGGAFEEAAPREGVVGCETGQSGDGTNAAAELGQGDWLDRMRKRDADLQARIAQGDAAWHR